MFYKQYTKYIKLKKNKKRKVVKITFTKNILEIYKRDLNKYNEELNKIKGIS